MDGVKSREDYLEAILVLVKKTGDAVRKTDIAESMGFPAPACQSPLKSWRRTATSLPKTAAISTLPQKVRCWPKKYTSGIWCSPLSLWSWA